MNSVFDCPVRGKEEKVEDWADRVMAYARAWNRVATLIVQHSSHVASDATQTLRSSNVDNSRGPNQ